MSGTPFAERWLDSVRAQLDAARRVDAEALSLATDARVAVQEELAAYLASASTDRRRQFRGVATEIRELDLRIRACGATVIAALDMLTPAAPPTRYDRHALLRDHA